MYVLGHAGAKAALFACTGILLDRYGSVDEHELHGRAREVAAGRRAVRQSARLALAGLPPFGTGLGKSVAEEAAGGGFTVLFVAVSARHRGRRAAGRGARVLRARAEAAGRPAVRDERRGRGARDRGRLGRVPGTMIAVPAAAARRSAGRRTGPGPGRRRWAGASTPGRRRAPHWTLRRRAPRPRLDRRSPPASRRPPCAARTPGAVPPGRSRCAGCIRVTSATTSPGSWWARPCSAPSPCPESSRADPSPGPEYAKQIRCVTERGNAGPAARPTAGDLRDVGAASRQSGGSRNSGR